MCKQCKAGLALSIAMFASFVGSVIGALCMTFLSPIIADAAMSFGPGERFMLAVFGLSVIVAISGKSIAKGMVSAFLGMLMCCVGLDPTNGTPRYIDYTVTGLLEGFPFIPLLIGLFAVAEVIAGVERILTGQEKQEKSDEVIDYALPPWSIIKVIWPQIISGGTMIPLLSLGVPGDSVTAILLGAFSINKNVFDLGIAVAFGIIGWLMNKYEFSLSPILLALILGPMCEKTFVRFMTIKQGNIFAIFESPIAVTFLVIAVGAVLFSVWNQSKINKREAANKAAAKAAK